MKEKSNVTVPSEKKSRSKNPLSKSTKSKESVSEVKPYSGRKFWIDVKRSSFDIEALDLSESARKSLDAAARAGVSRPVSILSLHHNFNSVNVKKYFFYQVMRQSIHMKTDLNLRRELLDCLFTLDSSVAESLVANEPYLMQWVSPRFQTDALIERALAFVMTEDPYNQYSLVMNLKSIPEKWIPVIVPLYPKLYSVIPRHYHTEELALAVVMSDDRNVKYIPAPHSREVMEIALKGWVNAMSYIQPANFEDIHDLAKFALKYSLNSFGVYAGRVNGKIPPDIFDLYRKKCVASDYYPSYGVDEMKLTDAELYCMLAKNPLWIESYRIFIRMSLPMMKRVLDEGLFRNSVHLSDGEHTEATYHILKSMSDEQLELVFSCYDKSRLSDFYHVIVGRYHDLKFFTHLVGIEPRITLKLPPHEVREDWYRIALTKDMSLAEQYEHCTPTLEGVILELVDKALAEEIQ